MQTTTDRAELTTTILMSSNGYWSRGRSLSEAVQKIHKAAFKRAVLLLVFDVGWRSVRTRDEAREYDAADAALPEGERISAQPRVNEDGSPLAYITSDGTIMYACGAQSIKRGEYVHRTGKVIPHADAR